MQRTHSTQGADRTNRSEKEEEEEEGEIRRRELPLRWTEEEEEARQNTACLTSRYTSSFSIFSPLPPPPPPPPPPKWHTFNFVGCTGEKKVERRGKDEMARERE